MLNRVVSILAAVTYAIAFTCAPGIRQSPKWTTTSLNIADVLAPKYDKQLAGRWEEVHGNYILPPPIDQGAPRALLHFLGGAIVGAVPHLSYRYMLERLAEKGFLVVATPYNLSFDHLETCDAIIQRFERIAPMLAQQYGAVPVVGVGHSCGALLHLLITSLFPDTPRAANALMSFNNKPVKEAVPFFEEVSNVSESKACKRSIEIIVLNRYASSSLLPLQPLRQRMELFPAVMKLLG